MRSVASRVMLISLRFEPQLCFSVRQKLAEFAKLAHNWHTKSISASRGMCFIVPDLRFFKYYIQRFAGDTRECRRLRVPS